MNALLLVALLPGAGEAKPLPAKIAAQALADRIDALIDKKLKGAKVPAAPQADDAELVRRLALDLTGRIPDLLSARDFIDNPSKGKKAKLLAKLLADPRYSLHWANVWRNWLIADAADLQLQAYMPGMEMWLREEMAADTSYDRLVRKLLTHDPTRGGGAGGRSPMAFWQANQNKPENMASAATRIFLGVKLECAQCHNHPFAKWKKQQFWEMAAFFAGYGAPTYDPVKMVMVPPGGKGEIEIPGTGKKAKPRFIDGTTPKEGSDWRETLADWMTAKENPWLGRAVANRVWESLMGTGLVEPLDEESVENPASHPEVLDELAQQFVANGFSLKYLIESIALTKAYGRTSKQTHPGQADGKLFARARVRGMMPEQLYDSLALATGNDDESETTTAMPGFRPFDPSSPRADFLRRFPNHDKRSEQQTSILQALYLMNGSLVDGATSLEKNKNLKVIAEATSVPTPRRIRQLFHITLGRYPSPAESARMVKYVEGGGPTKDSARALCDVFWALLNSSEFCTNH
ncbi:MAG: DUF1549 and DUF1553 domain-containing protein [Gemmataceae bacterium]|nr:DUF1549 and DUF1553 domain-containing protein [Gemmataceae bacterium]